MTFSAFEATISDIPGKYEYVTSLIKFFALLISLILVFLASLVIVRFRLNGKHHGGKPMPLPSAVPMNGSSSFVVGQVQNLSSSWEGITRRIQSFNEADWKLAVIEGDKFVDSALRDAGYPGETMGERLMLIKPGQISSLQDLWDAHKLRNLIVHDITFKVKQPQTASAVRAFESVLRELGRI